MAIDIARVVSTFVDGWSLAFDILEPTLAIGVCALPCYGRICTDLSSWVKSRWPKSLSLRSHGSSTLALPRSRLPPGLRDSSKRQRSLASPRSWFGSRARSSEDADTKARSLENADARARSLEDADTIVASSISSMDKIQCDTYVEAMRGSRGPSGGHYLPELRFSAFGKGWDLPYDV